MISNRVERRPPPPVYVPAAQSVQGRLTISKSPPPFLPIRAGVAQRMDSRIERAHDRAEARGEGVRRRTVAQDLAATGSRWRTDYDNQETETVDIPSGKFKVSKGRGGQPNITTREEDFDGAKMKTTYADVAHKLNAEGKKVAKAVLEILASAGKITVDAFDATIRRAITFIISITHVAEEARYAAAGKVSRAELRAIVDGESTFNSVFAGSSPSYPQVDSAQGIRRRVTERSGYFDRLDPYMSESSDDESDAVKPRRSSRLAAKAGGKPESKKDK
jgi:hypothetical protein